jgi:hypothetical protein
VTSFNCGMLQIWTWFLCHCYTGLLDSCGYSKKLSSPRCLVSAGAKPGWYLITTLIITVSFLQLSHVLVVASSRGSVGIDQVRSREFWASWSQVDLILSVSHLLRSLWPNLMSLCWIQSFSSKRGRSHGERPFADVSVNDHFPYT